MVNEYIWDQIQSKMSLSAPENTAVNLVFISLVDGGIKARVLNPSLLEETSNLTELAQKVVNRSNLSESSEVFIYEEFGLELKHLILQTVTNSVNIPDSTDTYTIQGSILTEDSLKTVVDFSKRISTDKNSLFDELESILSKEGDLKPNERLSHGNINQVYYVDNELDTGWKFDGTIYRLTDKPYNYWAKGPETNYPTNMEEWYEFASETESEKKQVKNRDTYPIHFHPMKRDLHRSHPYIEWYHNIEQIVRNDLSCSDPFQLSIWDIQFDKVSITISGQIII